MRILKRNTLGIQKYYIMQTKSSLKNAVYDELPFNISFTK